MIRPVKDGTRITQYFGERPEVYARFGLAGHNGLDYGIPNGTKIVSPITGNVAKIGYDPEGYGNYVRIEGEEGGGVLAHLQKVKVNLRDYVTEGQEIALSDNTGFSDGAHLHWGVYKIPRDLEDPYRGYIDPLKALEQFMPTQEEFEKVVNELIGLKEVIGGLVTKKELRVTQDHLQDEIVKAREKTLSTVKSNSLLILDSVVTIDEIKKIVTSQTGTSGGLFKKFMEDFKNLIDKYLKK